jgi:glycosyltransferase involved in cell wall biosynthesis
MNTDKSPNPASIELSIVIPVYNSQEALAELVQRLEAVLPLAASTWELILVNDGSSDQSWQVIQSLQTGRAWLRGVDLMRNYGQHNALLCGIRLARGAVIVTMDDDLQHPPEEIPRLLDKLQQGVDVVYGTPQQEQHGLWRDLASQITKLALQSAMGAATARQVSAFRAFRSQLRQAFQDYSNTYVSIDVLLTWGSNRFAAVPVRHQPRPYGKSNYTFKKLARHAVNMVTGFSVLPLRLASLMGFAFSLFGLLVLVYVIGRYLLLGTSVPGFPFLASTIAIFSGVQLFALGIIGEYLSRMYFRSMDRPAFVVREHSGNEHD